MKLSIIVPVYNVEQYVEKCANSLLNQTTLSNDYEIIFVIDGSTDNSEYLIRNISKNYINKNIQILKKANGGLSSARNYGIKYSKGEYIWFIDSDDWIELNSIEILLTYIKLSPDVILMTQYYRNIGNKEMLARKYVSCKLSTGSQLLKEYPPTCAVCYICKHSFLITNSFTFYEGILHEDSELMPRLLYMASDVQTISTPLYHHFQREGSITHTQNPKRIYDLMIVLKSNMDFYSKEVKTYDKKYYARICSSYIHSILEQSRKMNKKVKSDVNAFFTENPILFEMLSQKNIQSYILAKAIKILPFNTTTIYNFLWKLKGRK